MNEVYHQIFRPTKLNSIWQDVEINYVVYIHNFMSQIFGVPKSSFLLIFHKWSYHGIQFHFCGSYHGPGCNEPCLMIYYIYIPCDYTRIGVWITSHLCKYWRFTSIKHFIFWLDLRIAELTVNLKSKIILQQVWDQVLILRKIWLL